MNKKRLFLTSLIGLVAMCCMAFSASLGWFANQLILNTQSLEGEIYTSYFYSGDGSEEDPYTITRPVHYYNMIELVNYDESFRNKHYQLGYDFDNDGKLEVFNYNDDGTIGSGYGKVLNLNKYKALKPIGDNEHPFGGEFNGSGLGINNINVTGNGVCDIGIFGYTTSDAHIHDIYYNNINIDVSDSLKAAHNDISEHAYVGYLAGHIADAASFNNTYLNNCKIIGQTNTSNIKNDWGYFGHCANAKSLEDFITRAKGGEAAWGGSIGMDELFNRINTFRSDSNKVRVSLPREQTGERHYYLNGVEDVTKYEEVYTNQENVNSYEYFDSTNPLRGRVVYGQQQENYLWGKRTHTRSYTITNDYYVNGFYAQYGNNYLRFTGGNAATTTNANDRTNLLVDTTGLVYYKYNNRTYYLYSGDAGDNKVYTTVASSTSKNQKYMYRVDGNTLQLCNSTATTGYTLHVSTDLTTISTDYEDILVSTDVLDHSTSTVDHTITHYTNGTYLPLNVYKSAGEITADDRARFPEENLVVNGAKPNNTGYIVGGTKDVSDNYGSAVRVASNYDYGDIYRALGETRDNGTNARYSSTKLQILTRTKNSNGTVYIQDDYNKNTNLTTNQTSLSYLANKTRHTVDELGLQMYNDSRFNLDTQFKASTSKLYCMRFNEFNIDLNNTITAEKVLLNGQIKTNYVLPEPCIDFNLKEKGYINFFGGGYRGATACDAFFSLYHVIRDTSDNIVELKRLSKIYGTENQKDPYIYQYVDGSYSIYNRDSKTFLETELLNGYTEQFDLKWVEEPGFSSVDNTVWYFEIPVNEGEYALGSATNSKTSTGGYIFYLDVGSNGVIEDETTCNTFGPVEYRDLDDTAENSICLITYDQPEDTSISIETSYDKDSKTYCITVTCDLPMKIDITLLDTDYKIIVNDTTIINQIKTVSCLI